MPICQEITAKQVGVRNFTVLPLKDASGFFFFFFFLVEGEDVCRRASQDQHYSVRNYEGMRN